jgi:hypothetical protein
MAIAGERERSLLCTTTNSTMEAYRAVLVTMSTKVVTYPVPATKANAITIGWPKLRHDGTYTIEVVMLNQITGTRFLTAGATLTVGAEVEVMDSFGQVKDLAGGTTLGVNVWETANAGELASVTLKSI